MGRIRQNGDGQPFRSSGAERRAAAAGWRYSLLAADADAAAAMASANPAIIGAVRPGADRWQTPAGHASRSEATGAVSASCKRPEANKSLNGRSDSNDTPSEFFLQRSTFDVLRDALSVDGDDTDIAFGHAIVRSAGLQITTTCRCPSVTLQPLLLSCSITRSSSAVLFLIKWSVTKLLLRNYYSNMYCTIISCW